MRPPKTRAGRAKVARRSFRSLELQEEMETALKTLAAFVGLVVNAWLIWFWFGGAIGDRSSAAQWDFELSMYLFKFGLPVFLVSAAIFILSFVAKQKASLVWRSVWGVNALIPVMLWAALTSAA